MTFFCTFQNFTPSICVSSMCKNSKGSHAWLESMMCLWLLVSSKSTRHFWVKQLCISFYEHINAFTVNQLGLQMPLWIMPLCVRHCTLPFSECWAFFDPILSQETSLFSSFPWIISWNNTHSHVHKYLGNDIKIEEKTRSRPKSVGGTKRMKVRQYLISAHRTKQIDLSNQEKWMKIA